ncbi:MAG: translation initiation factor IF-6 [Candidatus Nitrosopumilus limneticus]|nr:Translation initiation factor 6 [Candidatus Nitrosopumilus limneticus]MSS85560.1 translation initiation factor IF-6 [Nitrosopumilus sp.]PHY04841.1 MAG: translation initiation factor IF-6 [Nitrososphaerota archaeon]MDC4211847.1 translation initiation factor IF-6 [Candidatus Nitrosopumilus limneticus]MDC4214332.1 translation initiation factor IF-6 [Candidatus Nitrosopumilus limneticus]
MDIVKYDVYRGPNIGVYISVNDTIGLVPMGFAETKAKKLEEYLNIEIIYAAIANTRLIGALSVMNNKGFLLPTTAYQDEYDFLKNETKLEVGVLDTKFNALGNVICANDKGAIVSPALSKENCKVISDVMGVEVLQKKIAGSHLAGVAIRANNTGAVIHPETEEKDLEIIADVLGVNIEHSSINGGVPYVSSGILANNHCIVVGSLTSGSEIMNLTRAFLN